MKIVVWGINYHPEVTGIAPYNAALCQHLLAHGHQVRMVTSFCYYPAWKKLDSDLGTWFRTDDMDGVPAHRCWHYVPTRVSTLKRIVHEGTFVFTSLARLFCLKRPDVLVVVSPPLLLGAAAWLYSRLRGVPFVFHVQDLQPDAALGLGMLKPSVFTRMLYRLEHFAYSQAARVSGISRGMLEAYERKGVPTAKQVLFPNGTDLPNPSTFPARGRFRARHGLSTDEFLAVYSGNLGVKQGLEVLLDAAARLEGQGIRLLICGDGARRVALEQAVQARGLRGVTLMPLQPQTQYQEMLVDADVCLITQQAGAGAAFFPSKLLATLAYGRPVLAVADEGSELTRALRTGGFGIAVPPESPEQVAEALRSMAQEPSRCAEFGRAGREFVGQFDFQRVHSDFERVLVQVVEERLKQRSQPAN